MLDTCVSSLSLFSVLKCGCLNTQESQKIPGRVSTHQKSLYLFLFFCNREKEKEGEREGTEGLRGLEREKDLLPLKSKAHLCCVRDSQSSITMFL